MAPRTRLATTLTRIATLYMLLGLGVGMFMGISGQYAYLSVHSHASLVGWTTMALAALIYIVFPACERSRLARAHVWLHNVGLPLMVGGLMLEAAGGARAEPIVALGSTVVLVAMTLFTINVFLNARAEPQSR